MKDKAKSKVLHVVCALMFIASGILYSVSVTSESEATVYPLKKSDNTAGIPEDDRGNSQVSAQVSPDTPDGNSQISVPPKAKEELLGQLRFEKDDAKELININSADADELVLIPGIGPAKAEAIVTFRNENGPFEHIEDIMLVPGIKGGTYDKIKADIEVGR